MRFPPLGGGFARWLVRHSEGSDPHAIRCN
jgi:hypothetical protein